MIKQSESFQIGHVLIKVHNLKEAVKNYETLGFRVSYGSAPEKANNAMIYFEDGSFLELFSTSFGQPMDGIMKQAVKLMLALKAPYAGRLRNYTTPGEGFRDYALDSTKEHDYENNMEGLRKKGIAIHGPKNMKRKNVEGILMKWSLYFPSQERFPFFMSPYSPIPVLSSSKTEHPNGANGFNEIIISTQNWGEDLKYYQTIYQQIPPVETENSKVCCRFQVAGTSVVLEKGSINGIRKILLNNKNNSNPIQSPKSKSLDKKMCHGAEIALISTM